MYWAGFSKTSTVASVVVQLLPLSPFCCMEFHIQGTWSGPILFVLYTANLLRLVEKHQLWFLYADDTQIYTPLRTHVDRTVSNFFSVFRSVEHSPITDGGVA